MSEREMRAKIRCLRREARNLQTATIGLLVLAAAVNAVLFGAIRHWKDKYEVAVQIEREAIAAYGEPVVKAGVALTGLQWLIFLLPDIAGREIPRKANGAFRGIH